MTIYLQGIENLIISSSLPSGISIIQLMKVHYQLLPLSKFPYTPCSCSSFLIQLFQILLFFFSFFFIQIYRKQYKIHLYTTQNFVNLVSPHVQHFPVTVDEGFQCILYHTKYSIHLTTQSTELPTHLLTFTAYEKLCDKYTCISDNFVSSNQHSPNINLQATNIPSNCYSHIITKIVHLTGMIYNNKAIKTQNIPKHSIKISHDLGYPPCSFLT